MNETIAGMQMTGSTDVIALVLLGLLALLLLTIAVIVFIILRKRYMRNRVKFNILRKDGKVDVVRIKDVEATNLIGGHRYVFDADALVHRFWGREIYYFHGVKEPINFKNIREGVGLPEMSSFELAKVIDEKITEKMLAEKTIDRSEILIILAIVGIIVCIFFLFKMSSGINIADSPENVEILTNIIRGVLTGG